MADKLMYNYTSLIMIHKITPSVDYNYWLKRLDTTNQNSIKVLKVVEPTNKKTLIIILWVTSVINSLMSPFIPDI